MHLVFVNVPSLQRELDLCNIVCFTWAGVSVILKMDLLQLLRLSSYTSNVVFYMDRLGGVIVLYECIS